MAEIGNKGDIGYLTPALQTIVDYLWREEYNDWEEKDNPEDHIFLAVNSIKNWLGNQKKMKSMVEEIGDDPRCVVLDKNNPKSRQIIVDAIKDIARHHKNKE